MITTGTMMTCSFGAAPSALCVLPVGRATADGLPVATIMDQVPMLNIPPFGLCGSPANPAVAAATAAALGVPVPMPCVPVTIAPWMPGDPATLIGGVPALTGGCQLFCAWGGVIQLSGE